MTDATLRELERRFRASGSVEDEAVWLRARVRVGDLTEERLRLAAYFRQPAPLLALAGSPRLDNPWPKPSSHKDPGLKGISRFDKESRVRIASAAARSGLQQIHEWYSRFGRGQEPEPLELAVHAMNAADDWIVQQTRKRQRAAQLAAEAIEFVPGRHSTFRLTARAAACAAWRSPTQGAREAYLDAGDHKITQEAITNELVPWALGYGDPVRERVEARRREAEGEGE